MNLKASRRVAVYLLVYLGVPLAVSMIHNQTADTVLVIVYIYLFIPFAILRAIDFYRTNDDTTKFGRVFNIVFRVPLALFGLTCLVVGVAIIGWVLYNVFVQRQKEYSGPSFIFGLGSFGVGAPLVLYGWFALRSVLRRKKEFTPEELEEFEHEEDDEEGAAKTAIKSDQQKTKK
jgi:hypothetical protein